MTSHTIAMFVCEVLLDISAISIAIVCATVSVAFAVSVIGFAFDATRSK